MYTCWQLQNHIKRSLIWSQTNKNRDIGYDGIPSHWQLWDDAGSSLPSSADKMLFSAYWQNDLLLQARQSDKVVHTFFKNKQMQVTGKREGQEVCFEEAPEPKVKIAMSIRK